MHGARRSSHLHLSRCTLGQGGSGASPPGSCNWGRDSWALCAIDLIKITLPNGHVVTKLCWPRKMRHGALEPWGQRGAKGHWSQVSTSSQSPRQKISLYHPRQVGIRPPPPPEDFGGRAGPLLQTAPAADLRLPPGIPRISQGPQLLSRVAQKKLTWDHPANTDDDPSALACRLPQPLEAVGLTERSASSIDAPAEGSPPARNTREQGLLIFPTLHSKHLSRSDAFFKPPPPPCSARSAGEAGGVHVPRHPA